ncbi:hypothetical protein AMK29_05655 [Streptomyces sp. CB02261]|nr:MULTISPECIES: hypothetical protein [Streptomyces]OKJ67571.1 hypothetical protein AMK29_05655 [Streptomyces sp. CB02261]
MSDGNQAPVFYHLGSVDELLAAACRRGAEQQLGALTAAVEELNPVARKAVTYALRRQGRRTR